MAIKIYIDQGHNPENPNAGAEGNGLREQDITFEVGLLLADLLRRDGKYEVRLSRPTAGTQIGGSNAESLRLRVEEANRFGADFFISIHTNASDNPAASGTESLVYAAGGPAYRIGALIAEGISDETGIRNRGVKLRPGLYVLRRTAMPAVLSEIGFITNPGDAALMTNKPELFAEGIYEGIDEYFG